MSLPLVYVIAIMYWVMPLPPLQYKAWMVY